MEEREGKSGRCMAGAPNVAAPTREPFLVVTLDGAKARLLVGLAASFLLDEPAHLLRGASARHRNLWRRSRARSVSSPRASGGDGAHRCSALARPPQTGLPRKGRDVRVVGAADRRCRSGRPAPGRGGPQRPRHLQLIRAWASATVLGAGAGCFIAVFTRPGDRSPPLSTCGEVALAALRAMGPLRGCGGSWGGGGQGRACCRAVVVVLCAGSVTSCPR